MWRLRFKTREIRKQAKRFGAALALSAAVLLGNCNEKKDDWRLKYCPSSPESARSYCARLGLMNLRPKNIEDYHSACFPCLKSRYKSRYNQLVKSIREEVVKDFSICAPNDLLFLYRAVVCEHKKECKEEKEAARKIVKKLEQYLRKTNIFEKGLYGIKGRDFVRRSILLRYFDREEYERIINMIPREKLMDLDNFAKNQFQDYLDI